MSLRFSGPPPPELALGDEARARGDLAQAADTFRAGMEGYGAAWRPTFRARLLSVLATQKRTADQEVILRNAIEVQDESPNDLEWSYRELIQFLTRHVSVDEAAATARNGLESLRNRSGHPWLIRLALGELLAKSGEHEQAIAEFRRAAEEASDAAGFSQAMVDDQIGLSLIALGRVDEAEALEGQMVADGHLTELTHSLADWHRANQQWSRLDALQRRAYAAAVARGQDGPYDPPAPDSWVFAVARGANGAAEPGARAQRWALELGREDLAFSVGHQYGMELEQVGKLEGAIEHYRSLIEAGTTHGPTVERLLTLLVKLKLFDEALRRAEAALTMRLPAHTTIAAQKVIARLTGRPKGRGAGRTATPADPFLTLQGVVEWRRLGQPGMRLSALKDHRDVAVLTTSGADAALWRYGGDGDLERVADLPAGDRRILRPDDALVVARIADADRHDLRLSLAVSSVTVVESGQLVDAIAAEWGYAVVTGAGVSCYDRELRLRWRRPASSWRDGAAAYAGTPTQLSVATTDDRQVVSLLSLDPLDGKEMWRWRPSSFDDWGWLGPEATWSTRARAARLLEVPADDIGAAGWIRAVSLAKEMATSAARPSSAPVRAFEVLATPTERRGWSPPKVFVSLGFDGAILGVGARLVGVASDGTVVWSAPGPTDCRQVVVDDIGLPLAALGGSAALLYRDGLPESIFALSGRDSLATLLHSRLCIASGSDCYLFDARGEIETHLQFEHGLVGIASVRDELLVLSGSRLFAIRR